MGAPPNLDGNGPNRGRGWGLIQMGSVAIGLAAAGPNEGVAFTILVVEQVGEDRRVETRIVEFEREIVAALVGALGPRSADLGFMRSSA